MVLLRSRPRAARARARDGAHPSRAIPERPGECRTVLSAFRRWGPEPSVGSGTRAVPGGPDHLGSGGGPVCDGRGPGCGLCEAGTSGVCAGFGASGWELCREGLGQLDCPARGMGKIIMSFDFNDWIVVAILVVVFPIGFGIVVVFLIGFGKLLHFLVFGIPSY